MMRSITLLVMIAALLLVGVASAEQAVQPSSSGDVVSASPDGLAEGLNEPAPIVVWNRPIAVLRASYEDSTPAERARRSIARIEALPARSDWEVITVEATAKGLKGIFVGTQTQTLFALLPGDLDPNSGETLEIAARTAADRLKRVLDEHADQLQWSNLARNIGLTALATALFALSVWGLFRLRNKIVSKLERLVARLQLPLIIAGINLAPILLFFGRTFTRLTTWAVLLSATYLWLTFCLGRFFFTQPWADRLGEYLIALLSKIALGMAKATPGLLTVLVIGWLTRAAADGVSRFFRGVERGYISVAWLQPDSARASRRIVIAVIWIFALTVAYPYIPGSGSEAFKGVSVFAGLMLSLGATGFINHVMSGLVIAYSGAMRVGDYVVINGIEGTVEELGPMSTKLATPKKEFVTVPNGVAIGGHVVNYSRLAGREGAIVSTPITIGYDAPWRQVHALLIQAAQRTAGVRQSPAPFVLQRALSDFYVEYELRVHIDQPARRVPILSELHAAIQDAFNEAGVQIMSPNFEAQPDKAVIVPKAKWYAPPAAPEGQAKSGA